MAQKREISADILAQAYEQTQVQKASGGYSATSDPNFPVLPTFLQQQVVMYFPITNVQEVDGEKELIFTRSVRHSISRGNYTQFARCIHGLNLEALGWDGTCPLCESAQESWELYNKKLDREAVRLGLPSRTEDPNELLKSFKEKANKDREIDSKQAFITTPVVVVPTNDKLEPNMEEEPKAYFLDWREQRWVDNMVKVLQGLRTKPSSPAGLFLIFDYNYDTKGKQPNAMDAARKMTISVIQDTEHLAMFSPYIGAFEEAAKEFTVAKANEVIIANALMFKDEVEKLAEEGGRKTRNLLAALNREEEMGGALPMGTGVPQGQPMGQPVGQPNQLLNYGQGGGQPIQNAGMEQSQQPMGAPVGQPIQQPMGAPMGQSAGQPMGQPVQQPMGQPIQQPMGQPIQQPMGQPVPTPEQQ